MRKINNINLAITDACNRACVDCCCNVPQIRDKWNCTTEYIREIGSIIGHVGSINLTGGEPTIHPRFLDIVSAVVNYIEYEELQIETNGFGFLRNPENVLLFDKISVTSYGPGFDGPNLEEVNCILKKAKNSKTTVVVYPIRHVSRAKRGTGKTCARGTGETVSIYKGTMYPCCMGWGIDGATGIPVAPDWRKQIESVDLPCINCFFSG
jgi:hypothetical protein